MGNHADLKAFGITEDWTTPPALTASDGGMNARRGPLDDQGPFQLGHSAEYLHDEGTHCRRCIDRLSQGFKSCSAIREHIQEAEQIREGPRQAIQLPNHQDVTRQEFGQSFFKLRPMTHCRGFFLIDARDAGRIESIELQAGFLILG